MNCNKEYRVYPFIKKNNWEMVNINLGINRVIPFKPISLKNCRRIKMDNNMEEFTFTIKYSEFNGRIITQEHILYNGKPIPVKAAWDTGSTYTCISKEFAENFELKSCNMCDISTTYGKKLSNLYDINVILNDDLLIPLKVSTLDYIHQEGIDLLIGMDIISKGDFSISTFNDVTCFSFRIPSKGLIDFKK